MAVAIEERSISGIDFPSGSPYNNATPKSPRVRKPRDTRMIEKQRPVGRPKVRTGTEKRLRLSVYADEWTERVLKMAAVMENQPLVDFVTSAAVERALQVLEAQGIEIKKS